MKKCVRAPLEEVTLASQFGYEHPMSDLAYYALEKSQAKQKRAADLYRRELLFEENDRVLLRFEKARLRIGRYTMHSM